MSQSKTLSALEDTSSLQLNGCFIDELYNKYIINPADVDPSWRQYFKLLEVEENRSKNNNQQKRSKSSPININLSLYTRERIMLSEQRLAAAAQKMVEGFRSYGHLAVDIEPVKLAEYNLTAERNHALDYAYYGIEPGHFSIHVSTDFSGVHRCSIRDLHSMLKQTYCNNLGCEISHLSPEERAWWQDKLEINLGNFTPTAAERESAIEALVYAETFERYLHKKFVGAKRFSIEGLESTVVALNNIIANCSKTTKNIVLGMAHRGRLTVLNQIIGKPAHCIMYEFMGNSLVVGYEEAEPVYSSPLPHGKHISGDVKYHMGWENDKSNQDHEKRLILLPNPSHLESINGVAMGSVRAMQDRGDESLAILMHGDAALAGQGVMMETLAMGNLQVHKIGGTIHLAMNNQVGFTAEAEQCRSTRYCTDIAKFINAPIFHVNARSIDALIWIIKAAMEYRKEFGKDVFIDIVGYRLHGHNETDEPRFTQPKVYSIIQSADFKSIAETYINDQKKYSALQEKYNRFFDSEYEIAQNFKPEPQLVKEHIIFREWNEYIKATKSKNNSADCAGKTHLVIPEVEELKTTGKQIATIPLSFEVHAKVRRQYEKRLAMYRGDKPLDWGAAEALAFAAIFNRGVAVRLVGQDVERGTFTHRHSAILELYTGEKSFPLANYAKSKNTKFTTCNSHLSEYGALSFEYGYSTRSPQSLTIWEAQFGDFVNGAQTVIDQYISSAENKWLSRSKLVMLLPHGYEGQGPEHSSARLERFLQLCAENNIVVCNCSTPASFFHLLYEQALGNRNKPLVVMTPKSLLRHKLAVSNLEELAAITGFKTVLTSDPINSNNVADNAAEENSQASSVSKIIFCSGKIYYDLLERRTLLAKTQNEAASTKLVCLEQLYPFPAEKLFHIMTSHPESKMIWCQEEPQNMGAYHFVQRNMSQHLPTIPPLVYVGRPESASPATGLLSTHNVELEKLLRQAFEC